MSETAISPRGRISIRPREQAAPGEPTDPHSTVAPGVLESRLKAEEQKWTRSRWIKGQRSSSKSITYARYRRRINRGHAGASAAARDAFLDAEACALRTPGLMYCRAQICIYCLLWTAALSPRPTLQQETTTVKSRDCPTECICLSPKQVLCNTGGLKDIPTQQLPPTVEELSLTKNNFPIIKGDAFAGLRVLRKLTMDGNNISTIRPFAFRGLSRLRELSIQHTPLPFIEKFSFAALQNVSVLLLANNKIRYIEGYSFAGTSNIRVILLSNNPLLRIQSHAFSGLTNVVRLIFPSGIRTIEPDAFEGLQHVGLLKLTYMDLSSLQSYTFRGLSYVHSLNIQESDLGVVEKDAFAGLVRVDRLNILNNKIDLIERLYLRYENSIELLRFHGNHVLEAPRHARDINLEVNSISAVDNHFPCDCQAHNVLESDFVNGTVSEFQKNNYCISPIEYNGKPMNLVDFDLIARCHDNVVQDNLGSGVVGIFTLPTTLFLVILLSMNLFQ